MKPLMIYMLIAASFLVNTSAQNRICGWDSGQITAIEVEFNDPDTEMRVAVFRDSLCMDAILSFLREVDFRQLDASGPDSPEQNDGMKCRIVFQGQRDQVYLYRHSACIGKTSFIIDPGVILQFETLIDGLTKDSHSNDKP